MDGDRYALIVTADGQDTEALRDLLELWGFRASVVHDTIDAVAFVRVDPPAVVLLDLDVGGDFAIAGRLRAAAGAPLTVVLLAGNERDRTAAIEAGVDAVFLKPASFEELRAAIDVPPDACRAVDRRNVKP